MVKNNRVLNCIKSRNTERDWRIEHAIMSEQISKEEKLKSIPAEKDLRKGCEKWWQIDDQGNTGSCVGQATAGAVLRWQFATAGRLAKDHKLSVRFIWMASKEMDEFEYYPSTFLEADGTSLKAALDVARNFGCVEDSDLPFEPEQLYPGDPETFYGKASRYMIRNYFNMSKPETKLDEWRKWIATKGPVLTRLDVDDTWMECTKNLDDYNPDKVYGGHAVALVGYTKDRFIVRNSWGEEWGDKGYAYASIDYAKAAFDEAYGVTIFL